MIKTELDIMKRCIEISLVLGLKREARVSEEWTMYL